MVSDNEVVDFIMRLFELKRGNKMNKPESPAAARGGLGNAIRDAAATARRNTVPLVGDDVQIDWTRIDTGVEFEGKKIVLPGDPADMPYDVAIDTLKRIKASEAQTYDVTETVTGLPWDALVSIYRAMVELYGVVLPETMRSWFHEQDPEFMTIRTGYAKTDVVQVPVGLMRLPNMRSPVKIGIHKDFAFISGSVHKADRARVVEIAHRAREIMHTESIYKGKAFSLKVDKSGEINVGAQPVFFDITSVKESDMIHNETTAALIESSIFAPIKHREACLKHKIPLKRGILLEGRYGTGKTLTARVTAAVAANHGWTFIVLDKADGLSAALGVAAAYQPSVVFAEDIDRFGNREKESVNKLVNLIDGLIPANAAVMTVLTTNFIEQIDKSLLRPGRFDAVISIDAPDARTVAKLVRHYGGEALPEHVDVYAVGEILAGQIPATIAEVVKRAKLMMLTVDREELTAFDLETAANGMARHLKLLDDTPPAKSPGDRLFGLLQEAAGGSTGEIQMEMAIGIERLVSRLL